MYLKGKSQKEGQEDQGKVKELGGTLPAVLGFPGPSGLPSGSSLDCLELGQGIYLCNHHPLRGLPGRRGPPVNFIKKMSLTQYGPHWLHFKGFPMFEGDALYPFAGDLPTLKG